MRFRFLYQDSLQQGWVGLRSSCLGPSITPAELPYPIKTLRARPTASDLEIHMGVMQPNTK